MQNKTFYVMPSVLDEEGFIVEASSLEEAREEALRELGWYVIEADDELEADE